MIGISIDLLDFWLSLFGSLVFSLQQDESPPWKRAVHFPIGTFVGYFFSAEVLKMTSIETESVAAYFGGAICIATAERLISMIKKTG